MSMKNHKLLFSLFLASAMLGYLPTQVDAQVSDFDNQALQEVFREIAEMGPNLNIDIVRRTEALFARLHLNTDKGGVRSHRDLRYGSDSDRHLLDVYTPENGQGPRPAVVFVHGGGLVHGHKDNESTDLMYANIATYFARNGMVGINATYRLVPSITYPQGGEDMKAIVEWIRNNADEYGIAPEQIFFVCASAGCTHVASLLFDANMMEDGTPDIAGAIMLSGSYEAYNTDYYGADEDRMRRNAPLGLARAYAGLPVPVLLMSAEYDPQPIELETVRLLLTLCETRSSCPQYIQARDHNHVSINRHINTSDERYSRPMLDFIREVAGESGAMPGSR